MNLTLLYKTNFIYGVIKYASFFLLNIIAGALWSLLVTTFSNTKALGWQSFLLGSGIGLLMGALIFPWVRKSRPTVGKTALLALITYVIAIPLFLIVSDISQSKPFFAHDFATAISLWPYVAFYCLLPPYSLVLFPLSTLTVYTLWYSFYLITDKLPSPDLPRFSDRITD
jgi:hypothetical protein